MSQPNPVAYMLSAYHAEGHKIPAADLLAAYAHGPRALEDTVTGLTHEQWTDRPIEGKWTPLELVAHLADCDQFLADRMKRTIALTATGDRPLLMGVNENLYLAAFNYNTTRDPAEELALLRATRTQMSRILKTLPEDAFSRQAVHSEAGLLTLHHILFHATYHLQHHLRFLEQKLRVMFGYP